MILKEDTVWREWWSSQYLSSSSTSSSPLVSSLSAPWYVMYVHNPSNDRTYCNRPPGGNHIYLFLIFILFMSFFRRHDLPFGIAIIISDMLILLKRNWSSFIIGITVLNNFKDLRMQRDELGSNSGDLGLKSNLVFQLPNLEQNLPQSHRSITNAHCLTTFDHSASSPPFRIIVWITLCKRRQFQGDLTSIHDKLIPWRVIKLTPCNEGFDLWIYMIRSFMFEL